MLGTSAQHQGAGAVMGGSLGHQAGRTSGHQMSHSSLASGLEKLREFRVVGFQGSDLSFMLLLDNSKAVIGYK
jgi:hypothetical protein